MAALKPILLVEDNPNDIELTLAALESSQLANEIVICRDGAEALDFIYRRGAYERRPHQDPAVVLLDLKLPKVDGLEVLAKVKGDPATRAVPVVMLTSSREETDVVRSYNLGVNAFVVKPVAFDEFFAAIKEIGVFWALLNEPPPHRGRLAIERLTDAAAAPLRILHLEDSDLDAELIEAELERLGQAVRIVRVMSREAFAAEAVPDRHDLILADYVLPTFDGLSALSLANGQCPDIPFVFCSGTLGEEIAVEALKNGATDYVTKQRLDRLPRTVVRALAEAGTRAEKSAARAELQALNRTLEARVAERTRELAEANAALKAQIEERERVEEALRLAQRLEAVGQLTSGVAHDFNNLLTVIAGNIEFLERAVTDDRSRRRLDMMRGAAARGANLTAQLLAFSRRQRLEPTPVSLNRTVASMRDLLTSSIGAVRIETALHDELWPALVDATQVELVILNLAINARDAMAVGGRLTIETANMTVRSGPTRPEHPQPGEYVMVSVSDTGTGMSPEVLARVFEPFFTTKAVGKGSGLGLAQVYGFVKQSGGGLRIDTVPGEGTSIKVYLPRADDGAAAPAADAAIDCARANPPGVKPALLVVDDDGGVREVTATRLVEAGYAVREAASGLQALAALEADPCVDLVVIDFAMPGMNGAEAAIELRKRWPHIPVLFVTGYADTAALSQAGAVGADGIVQKPFRNGELERKVAAALAARPMPGLRLITDRDRSA